MDLSLKFAELSNDQEIVQIIEMKNHLELAKYIGRKLCNFTPEDEKYIDIFWDAAFNKSWLYLSDSVIIEWMGYKKSKDAITNFIKEMKSKYRNLLDYQEVDKQHNLIQNFYSCLNTSKKETRGGSLKKYYIITGDTLKKMLLRAGTKQGDATCDYFIKIEKLASITSQYIFQFMEKKLNNQLLEKDALLTRLHTINAELLTYKKLKERNESIYLVSTFNQITNGLIKVGRTKNIKSRNSSHNTTHPAGDKIHVLAEFKVNDSTLIESIIHKKLAGLRPDKNSEFFMCPYDLLYNIIDMIIKFDDKENEAIDTLIDTVFKMKQKVFEHLDWTAGLDMSIFDSTMKLIEDGESQEVHATFDMKTATKEQKDAFIRDCILAYHKNISIPQKLPVITWTVFQTFFIDQMKIPKKEFKALEWRDSFKDVAKQENIDVKMRK